MNLQFKQKSFFVYFITLLVAFCSIVYELVYSQTLTIVFGGTVQRYAITIGLFLFFLGIGSFYYKFLNSKKDFQNFIKVEIILSIMGPLGFFFIIYLNSYQVSLYTSWIYSWILLVLSHIPIALVGFLSGLEIPLLSGILSSEKKSFSQVLGFDYLGSLVGTLVYALYFYPHNGLIFTVIFLGLVNILAAGAFIMYFKLYGKKIFLTILTFLVILFYIFSMVNQANITDSAQNMYFESVLNKKFNIVEGSERDVKILEVSQTPYQQIVKYDLILPDFAKDGKDTCLNLDNHIQLCESWVEAYHEGLTDFPMCLFDNQEEVDVLIIGGGDWIAVNNLQKYGLDVTLVDIDVKFTEYTKKDEFVSKYHNDSFNYENLDFVVTDGYNYLKNTDKKFDLIILDLPGLESDKLLHLYSYEFFRFAKETLTENGFLITWIYSPEMFPEYYLNLHNTLSASGFKQYSGANSFYNLTQDIKIEVENYEIYSSNEENLFPEDSLNCFSSLNLIEGDYIWKNLENDNNLKVNSVFSPNYKMIIGKPIYEN